MDPSKIRKKIRRFRILIIGRANAGKTTILRRVCNTRDNPIIYNSAGKKIDIATITASRERGEHDIDNELVFESNPGFVFHDSRGFEAGSATEFDKVKEFITSRSKKTKLSDQLHAIWYCIPMDEAHRSFTEGENKFFSQCDTGTVPVIVLFTKFDAFYDVAFAELKKEGKSRKDAKELAPKHAEESFVNGPQLKFLKDVRWPPKCHVCLPNMNNDDADCGPLMERTAGTLGTNEVLEQLFVSTQQSNLELCVKYAVDRTLKKYFDSKESEVHEVMIARVGVWFPHISVQLELQQLEPELELELQRQQQDYLLQLQLLEDLELDISWGKRDVLRDDNCVEILSRLRSVVSGSSPLENIIQLISAAVIIFEHSFYIFDKRRYLQDLQKSDPSFYVALEQYMPSPYAATVREAVIAAVQAYKQAVAAAARAYEDAVATAAHAYDEAIRTAVYPRRPTWTAKLPFESSKRKAKEAFERSQEEKKAFERFKQMEKESIERSQAEEKESSCSRTKAELFEAVLQITLNHRLPRP